MGDDIAALLNQLSISKGDIVGLSLGAAVRLAEHVHDLLLGELRLLQL